MNRYRALCNFENESDIVNINPNFICTDEEYAVRKLHSGLLPGQFSLYLVNIQHRYKNIYCALCNGWHINNVTCSTMNLTLQLPFGPDMQEVPSFTVLMDFTHTSILYNKKTVCKENEILSGNECIQKMCPSSMITVNGSCYSFNASDTYVKNLYTNMIDIYVKTVYDEQLENYLRHFIFNQFWQREKSSQVELFFKVEECKNLMFTSKHSQSV